MYWIQTSKTWVKVSQVYGTVSISLTNSNTSDTNSFWDAFDEILFIASFIPIYFSSTICVKVLSWVSNSNLSRSLLKLEDIAEVHDQNLFHAKLLKAAFLLSQESQCTLSAEIYHKCSWQPYQLLDEKIASSIRHLSMQILQELLVPHIDSKFFIF